MQSPNARRIEHFVPFHPQWNLALSALADQVQSFVCLCTHSKFSGLPALFRCVLCTAHTALIRSRAAQSGLNLIQISGPCLRPPARAYAGGLRNAISAFTHCGAQRSLFLEHSFLLPSCAFHNVGRIKPILVIMMGNKE